MTLKRCISYHRHPSHNFQSYNQHSERRSLKESLISTYKINVKNTQSVYGEMAALPGIVEAETEKHELFGDDRLIACLDGKGGSSAASITELVKNSVNAFV